MASSSSSASAKRHPPLRPSSTTNRAVRGLEKRINNTNLSNDTHDDEYAIASGKQVPRTYLLKLIKGSRMNGILNLASRGLTEVPTEIFLDEIIEDENQQRPKLKTADFTQNNTDAWWNREPLKTLDLSSNSLITLPNEIETLDNLLVLIVQNNQLTSLPDSIRRLRLLEKFVLTQNQLTTLPDGLFYCSSLLYLNLSRNHLTKLSTKIGDLSYLQELDLSENDFELFPKQIGYLTKLTKLTVAKNRLRALPNEFGALYNLRSLDISHNQLTQLPDSFGDLINLEEVYANSNRLTIFPCFNQCTKLKEIHLADNQLTEISDSQLESLLSLLSLNVRGNKIRILPEQIALLPNLERLDVTNNELADLPSKIALNKKIKNISMIGNPLGKIRKDVIRLGTESIMKYLRNRLTIDDGNTTENQKTFDIAKPTETEDERKRRLYTEQHVVRSTGTFDFSHKNASSLSDESIELILKEKPSHVNLAKNKFTEMPIALVKVAESLLHLDLSSNGLLQLNPQVGQLKELRFLDLNTNRLTDLPSELSSLEHLQIINLSMNKFVRLPSVLYELKHIQEILANDNQLIELDANGIVKISATICTFNVRNNNIQRLPPEFSKCTLLKSLDVAGNPFKLPRPATIAKGTQAILEHLRNQLIE
ncbi:unnamed protein product [Adineta steineri]|uniref:Leucine-rich repeat-containing protein 40 n=1 Tax=Adineta steineri TaxID=433720 RepID=A0A813RKG1_9BILA|nr:unnamed protein product [Adineta steineri]CAF0923690.1 unnamed protein product [Adineta steineri]